MEKSQSPYEEKSNSLDHLEDKSDTSPRLNKDTHEAAKILKVGNLSFAAAVAKSPIDARSKASFMLYFCCFVSFLGACANGYDGSLFSGISPMKPYQDFFEIGTVGHNVSLVFSMYSVGSIIGPLFAGPIADRFGRRVGMFVGGAIIVLGMILTSSAQGQPQLIGGRFVLGFGISIMTVAAPAYCVEIAPGHWRGRFVGFYNNGWFGGSIPAAAVTFGCNYLTSNWAWRIPMIGQGIPSIAVMVCVFFIPKSPRWLLQVGRDQEALEFLVKYHGNGDPNSALVKLEWEEMNQAMSIDKGSSKRWWDYRDLFLTANARWRFLNVMMISVFGQFSGNGLGYFNNVIYNNLGYTSSVTQLGLNLGNSCMQAVVGFTAAGLTDRMPRMKVLPWGTFAVAICLAINGGLGEAWARQPTDTAGNPINPNLALGQGALAFFFLFNAVYTFTYTPLQGVFPVENLTNGTRAKGLAASGIMVSLIGFINTYASPIALENIKNRYVFVFVGWDIIEALCWYFFGVETIGRTVEELDEVYNAPYPPFDSRKKRTVAVKGDVFQEVE